MINSPCVFAANAQHITFRHDSVLQCLEVMGVKPLSENVETDYVTEMYHPLPELQAYVRFVLPFIQRLLFGEYDKVSFNLTPRLEGRNEKYTLF